MTHSSGIVKSLIFRRHAKHQMNKFAKGLLLALVFAAPVALTAPATQAKTTTPAAKTATVAAKPVTGVKATKVGSKRKRHRKPQASGTPKTTPTTNTPAPKTPSNTTPTTPGTTTPGS